MVTGIVELYTACANRQCKLARTSDIPDVLLALVPLLAMKLEYTLTPHQAQQTTIKNLNLIALSNAHPILSSNEIFFHILP